MSCLSRISFNLLGALTVLTSNGLNLACIVHALVIYSGLNLACIVHALVIYSGTIQLRPDGKHMMLLRSVMSLTLT
jgi:hypothetical protein